jgi:Short C-terminal domain
MRVSLSTALLLLSGCASPLGPPFGPGPEDGSVLGILILLLLAGVLYRSVRSSKKPEPQDAPAIHVVRERYARGELTREEFQNMMRDLSKHPNGI